MIFHEKFSIQSGCVGCIDNGNGNPCTRRRRLVWQRVRRIFGGGYEVEEQDLLYSTDSGYGLGVTVGRVVAPNIRAEVELAYSEYELDSYENDAGDSGSLPDDFADLRATYLLGNVWYDIPNVGAAGTITPYVGGGLGLGVVDYSVFGADLDTANALAYQIGAGVQFPVGTGKIDAGYRYKGTASFNSELDGADVFGDVHISSHNLQVGYVFDF